jgi:hypothetical protein
MIRKLLPVLLFCCVATAATAASLAGVTLRDTYPLGGQTLVLNGIGLRSMTIFHVRVYVVGLYLTKPSHDAQAILASPDPKVIVMQFLHAASKDQMDKQYREGEANNCGHGECDPSDEADFERLVAAAPAMEVGDTSTYIFTERGMRVYANQTLVIDIANRDLAFHMLAGFIGDHPPTPELRRALLGLPPE